MSIAMMLKLFSDCCICFAILGSGPVTFEIPLLLPALICGVCAGIAAFLEKKGWKALRKCTALLPLLCLLMAADIPQMVILGIPALYTAVIIARGKLELEYYSYSKFFLKSLALVGGAYVLENVWLFLVEAAGDPVPALDSNVILRYGLVHLFCGVLLQRRLRLGVDRQSEGNKGQISTLLGLAAAILLAFVLAEPALRQFAGKVMEGILALLGIPVMFVVEVVSLLLRLWKKKQPEASEDPTSVTINGEGGINFGGEGRVPILTPQEGKQIDPAIVWGGFAAVILLIAAVLLIRSFQKRRAAAGGGEVEGFVAASPKKKRASALSNRSKVRQFYREFLRVEKGWGMKLKISDTSADVLSRIHPETDRPSAEALRRVYLAARYNDREDVGRGMVQEAKRALKATRRPRKH